MNLEMVLIPAGEFKMGSPRSDELASDFYEEPQYRVRITKPFYLGKYRSSDQPGFRLVGRGFRVSLVPAEK